MRILPLDDDVPTSLQPGRCSACEATVASGSSGSVRSRENFPTSQGFGCIQNPGSFWTPSNSTAIRIPDGCSQACTRGGGPKLLSPEDIRHVRTTMHLTQQQFAMRLHVSVDTVRNWEQGRKVPSSGNVALIKGLLTKSESEVDAFCTTMTDTSMLCDEFAEKARSLGLEEFGEDLKSISRAIRTALEQHRHLYHVLRAHY